MRRPLRYSAKRMVSGFALLLVLDACGSSSEPSQPTNVAVQSEAIIGGSTAAANAWPWSVTIYFGGQLQCGGSLIAPEWVLSVGHCLSHQPGSSYSVQLNTGTMVPASTVVFNPNFAYDGPITGHSDVGLIRLAYPVTIGPGVNFIRPAVNGDAPGTNAVAIGWGYTDHFRKDLPSSLQQVTLPIVPSASCSAVNPARSTVYPDELCAGYQDGSKGICFGDSGSALMVQRASGTWEHVGMPSVVESLTISIFPTYCISYAVFSRTTAMVNWIRQYVPDPAWLPGLDLISM